MALSILTPDDLTAHDTALADLESRVAALEAQPASTGGGPVLIGDLVANNHSALGIAIPADYDRLLLVCSYVTADVQPGSLLNVYLSDDGGATYDTGPNYNNAGQSNWPGEPNSAYWPQPYGLREPQTLNLGCRLGIDVGERIDLAIHARAEFTAMGTVGANNVSPVYQCQGYAGFIGGAAGVSERPAHAGGGYWFAGDPVGTPFDWAAQFSYAGHWKKPGARIRAMMFTMNGGGTLGRLIKSGRFQLWGLS